MTNEAIRCAIAESLGWQYEPNDICVGPDKQLYQNIPNYPPSLDACREFEKDAPDEYWAQLLYLVREQIYADCDSYVIAKAVGTASPVQRCEAYLRTIGKWKE